MVVLGLQQLQSDAKEAVVIFAHILQLKPEYLPTTESAVPTSQQCSIVSNCGSILLSFRDMNIRTTDDRIRTNDGNIVHLVLNSLEFIGNYSATSNNIKLVHWPLMGGLLHLVQRRGDSTEPQPTQALFAVSNNNPPINGQCSAVTVLLYDGPLLCGCGP